MSTAEPHPHAIAFTIDGDPYSTSDRVLTPRQILTDYAKVDPASHYLIQVEGREQMSYETQPDEPIHMHEHQTFITAAVGPTPVS